MLVHSINNNQLIFGAVYVQKNNYTDSQKNTINQIKEALSQPSDSFSNQSAEDFYKTKGIDFFIKSDEKGKDTISLSGYDEVKHTGVGVDEAITCKESFPIGTYNEEHPFKTEDIAKGLKDFNQSLTRNIVCSSLMTLTFAGLFFSFLFGEILSKKPQNAVKPLIENFDSSVQKANLIAQDTVKTLKPVIK